MTAWDNADGVVVATALPYTPRVGSPADLRVDFDRYARHCDWLVSEGCRGVVPNSALGEFGSLTPLERRMVTRTAVEALGGRGTVLAGVHDVGSHQVVEWSWQAAEDGADALICMPPVSHQPTMSEVLRHFEAVASVGLPVVVCNNPAVARIDLRPSVLAEIAAMDNVVGVSDSSGDLGRLHRIRRLAPTVKVFAGGDLTVVENLLSGAEGWVAALPNVFPGDCVRLFDLIASGHLVEAQELREVLAASLRWESRSTFVQMIKFGMDYRGRYGGPCRPPRHPLPAEFVADAHRDVQVVSRYLEAREVRAGRGLGRMPGFADGAVQD
ncbi:dihydrodipicolinate synthase family protein [Lentzea sp. NBC_00516]|uniref:dihydrodipicolinate synthase family protein n=1 Tax=Lentzea sp. NBC_00516 TaxID=2903582 RepID=UPI002E80E01C|nr:dihydrodipicolinate synthase family protein [Lentzea sp. NBC_00516]WUD28532.1 dihydrodipicolinate synthase family protein [Lentzea sp. NBC_00516]